MPCAGGSVLLGRSGRRGWPLIRPILQRIHRAAGGPVWRPGALPGEPVHGRLLQPSLQAILQNTASLLETLPQATGLPLHLIPPATGAPQPVLAEAGAGQGQVVELVESGEDPTGLLIHDALRAEAPAAGARQARITAGHQVVRNASRPQFHRGIGQGAEGLTPRPQQLGLQEGGQALHRGGIAGSGLALDESLLLTQPPQLIQTPHQAPLLQGGGFAHPAEKAMDGRMHPSQLAGAVIQPSITAHASAQQVTQQQLLGKGQGLRSEPERASPGRCNRRPLPPGRAPPGWWGRCSASAPGRCRWPSAHPGGSEH